jgi:flagellar biosynthesis chaperone FliJ
MLQDANLTLKNAYAALEESLAQLQNIQQPQSGSMSQFLSSRELFDTQRALISHNKEWVAYAKETLREAQERLKRDMIEYEKFKYLELQLNQERLKAEKIQDAKDLDEIALMTRKRDKKERVA